MMWNKWSSMIVLAIVIGQSASAIAEDAPKAKLTVEEIVAKANHAAYYQGADGRARVKMNIVDNQGRTRERDLTILRWDAPETPKSGDKPDASLEARKDSTFDGEQKFYIYFHSPADVKGMSLLVWKHLDTEDDRWLYLPKIDLVKRIAGSEKRTSFAGSDFYYEDISGRNIDADQHELLEETGNYYVLKNTPKEPDKVDFAYYKAWIHRATFLVVKIEYYDKNDRPFRQYRADKVEKIDDYFTVTQSRMTDLQTNRYTDLIYSIVKYNLGIPEDIFTERYLRNPPTQYMED